MRIIYIIDALAIVGGLERVLIDKMNFLAENFKYEIFLITTQEERENYCFIKMKY